MSFIRPDPISLIADVITVIGVPTLVFSTISLYQQVRKSHQVQTASFGCLEFNDVARKRAINLVPFEQAFGFVPRIGDELYLPGEGQDYGLASYKVLKVTYQYAEAPEVNQPCPAKPAKVVIDVRKIDSH